MNVYSKLMIRFKKVKAIFYQFYQRN